MDNYHVSATDQGWELRKEGGSRASKQAATKDELLRDTATFLEGKTASVKIHKKDGTIQEERTYPRKADPRKKPGLKRPPPFPAAAVFHKGKAAHVKTSCS